MTTAAALVAAYRAGDADPVTVVEDTLRRIDAVDGDLGAFTHRCDDALATARQRRDQLRRGEATGPLHGVPVGIKELFDVAGAPVTYGSDVPSGEPATSDAQIVARLRAAGAVIVGTTRSHEFGWGITTQHAGRGSTRNPWAPELVPGGSSGGSAVAVAAGLVPLTLASDTGGSIRIPAGWCGVTGLKPTFGRLPRTGGVALAPSLDTPGFIATDAGDLALALVATSGAHPGDPASATSGPFSPRPAPADLAGVRIGFSPDLERVGFARANADAYRAATTAAAELGATVTEVSLPSASDALTHFRPFQMAEALHVHRELGHWPERATAYGADVRSRLEAATTVTIGDYLASVQFRTELCAAFTRAFAACDVILAPVNPTPPSPATDPDHVDVDGVRTPLRDAVMACTVPQNLAGLPSCVIRVGTDAVGVPVGAQVVGAWWQEATVLAVADVLARALSSTGNWPSGPPLPAN